MVGRSHRDVFPDEPPSSQISDLLRALEKRLRSGRTQRHDDLRAHYAKLPNQELLARGNLIRLGRPISWRPTADHVADVHTLTLEPHGRDHPVEQLARAPDERLALEIFVLAWPLPNKSERWLDVATDTEDHVGSTLVQLALLTDARPVLQDAEGGPAPALEHLPRKQVELLRHEPLGLPTHQEGAAARPPDDCWLPLARADPWRRSR